MEVELLEEGNGWVWVVSGQDWVIEELQVLVVGRVACECTDGGVKLLEECLRELVKDEEWWKSAFECTGERSKVARTVPASAGEGWEWWMSARAGGEREGWVRELEVSEVGEVGERALFLLPPPHFFVFQPDQRPNLQYGIWGRRGETTSKSKSLA
jgi:hypothetical protein